jgi:hypothetical protein
LIEKKNALLNSGINIWFKILVSLGGDNMSWWAITLMSIGFIGIAFMCIVVCVIVWGMSKNFDIS